MGADPATMAMFFGSMGGNMLNSVFAPEGQEIQSFADDDFSGNIHPAIMLENLQTMLHELYGDLGSAASQTVGLPGTEIQDVPVFSGGGLPMPIGVLGRDPAWEHPDLLFRQGLGAPPFIERPPGNPGPGPHIPTPPPNRLPPPGTPPPGTPPPPPQVPPLPGGEFPKPGTPQPPGPPPMPNPGPNVPMPVPQDGGNGDPTERALAAVELLIASAGEGGGGDRRRASADRTTGTPLIPRRAGPRRRAIT